jgi:hypothetical protein
MKWFQQATLFSALGLGFVSLLVFTQLFYVRQSDKTSYQEFAAKAKTPEAKPSATTSSQRREGVRKDIWFTQEDRSRLHYRIQSQASTLTLLPTDERLDIIENLEHIQCWMQDKLYVANGGAPMQQMRFFEADAGTYQYTTQKLAAQAVSLSLFRLPGHTIPLTVDPNTSFLHGIAKDVSFSFAGSTTQFQAEQFRATLNPKTEDRR